MADAETSHNHHFVPKLLLRPWLVAGPQGHLNLHGYWWDPRKEQLVCKARGLNSFCCQIDLLTLRQHHLGRDAIERIFFGEVDTKGAEALALMLERGPGTLAAEGRCNFARLLLSLDIRRPDVVTRLRSEGQSHLATTLNADGELRALLDDMGAEENASDYAEKVLGTSLEDRSLTVIQQLVDDPKVGGRLINAKWTIRRVQPGDGMFVLSDRPLIRVHGYNRPGATWVLPISPTAVFIAANHPANLSRLFQVTGQRLVKLTNVSSANQSDRFVFSASKYDERWLGKHLKRRAKNLPKIEEGRG